ncbi:DUF448 domain-containing protein [Altericroceibacterium endophyticum]|uniref:DUF448 domain-containing protein n=1 Tax=Altericroceibacterium endophyticum TaxID=1808508 RepID=A0A6I4T6K9_9SPHN|nr:DUF448 domain-containing protein [Altericroceibacterium endophyticum]MXO66298.1 DUF448 domain-containing protein [Altericroceibacterium endophyticum]
MRNPHNEPLSSDISEAKGAAQAAPERRCVLTGDVAPRDRLVRLALSPDDVIWPDPLARAPGRGAWIGVSRAELTAAMEKGRLRAALARAFKQSSFSIPEDLPQRIEDALRHSFCQRLGLEMRAGRLILGSDRIADQARMGRVSALYHASDAGEDGTKKLDQAFRVGMDAEGSGLTGICLPLDRATLSVALGRDNVVHMALADRFSAERAQTLLQRLLNYTKATEVAFGNDGNRAAAMTDPGTAATTNREYEG